MRTVCIWEAHGRPEVCDTCACEFKPRSIANEIKRLERDTQVLKDDTRVLEELLMAHPGPLCTECGKPVKVGPRCKSCSQKQAWQRGAWSRRPVYRGGSRRRVPGAGMTGRA